MTSSLCDIHDQHLPLEHGSGYIPGCALVHDSKFKRECKVVCDSKSNPDNVIVHDGTEVLYDTINSINDGTSTGTFSSNSENSFKEGHGRDSSPDTVSASRNEDSLSTYLNEYAVSFEFGNHSSVIPAEDGNHDCSGYTTEIFDHCADHCADHCDKTMNMDELPSGERKFVMGMNGYVLSLNQ